MDQALVGMCVRREGGHTGNIVKVTDKKLRIHWTTESSLLPVEEAIKLSDTAALGRVDLLTLPEGWVPLSEAMSAMLPEEPVSILEEIAGLLSEVAKSHAGGKWTPKSAPAKKASGGDRERADREGRKGKKAGKHNPFKRRANLGPGPRHHTHRETKHWKCRCSDYSCNCTNKGGGKKHVVIGRNYKKNYNAEFKAWRKAQRHRG